MQFKTTITVTGLKSSKGEFNGQPYDYTAVFFLAELKEGENYAGYVGEELRWGTSANAEKLTSQNLKYPLQADVTMEQVSNGKSLSTIIKSLTPQVQKHV